MITFGLLALRWGLLFTLCVEVCQPQTKTPPRFEAASVKIAAGSGFGSFSGGPGSKDPERVVYERTTLENLISDAYALRSDQISGPPWMQVNLYTITAKIPPGTSMSEYRQMLAALLSERFGLQVHLSTGVATGYEVIIAPGGPKMARSPTDSASSTNLNFRPSDVDKDGFPILASSGHWASRVDADIIRMTFKRSTMGFLAGRLSAVFTSYSNNPGSGHAIPVIDKTNLGGEFDFHLEFPVPSIRSPSPIESSLGGGIGIASDPGMDFASVSAALVKQLGLKLGPARSGVENLTVAHANPVPTPDYVAK